MRDGLACVCVYVCVCTYASVYMYVVGIRGKAFDATD